MKPIPTPEYMTYYQLLKMSGGKFTTFYNPELNSTGLFHRLEDAQNQQLMELIKDPANKYQIYEIEWKL